MKWSILVGLTLGVAMLLGLFVGPTNAQMQIKCEPVLPLIERFKDFEHSLDYRYQQRGDKDFIFLVMKDHSAAVYVLLGGGHMACQAGYATAAQVKKIFPEYHDDKGT